jgi:hypothetical protein
MSGQYDVLVTMDRSIEFQQRIPHCLLALCSFAPDPTTWRM